jgi:hypothetical protein
MKDVLMVLVIAVLFILVVAAVYVGIPALLVMLFTSLFGIVVPLWKMVILFVILILIIKMFTSNVNIKKGDE